MTHDVAIVGAGMAGASLAAALCDMAGSAGRIVLIEGESAPGYHATGRSAAFWTESYGGPAVQPLTTASHDALARGGFLTPRRAVHLAAPGDRGLLDAMLATFGGRIRLDMLDRTALEALVPGLRPGHAHGLLEASCCDIDVAALHAHYLAHARRGGVALMCDSRVTALVRAGGRWRIETAGGAVLSARIVVNAAGAWARALAEMAGADRIAIAPLRRTMVQLAVAPAVPAALPLVIDAAGRFYLKPGVGGRLWLSPHDETLTPAGDVAPDELDVAVAIDRLQQVVDWTVLARERAWAGLRSFAPDRAPVYGFDRMAPGFFWFAGQGGFGIQTAPAAAMIGAALLTGGALPEPVRAIDVACYAPERFGPVAAVLT